MEDHLLNFAEWDNTNKIAEAIISTPVGDTKWIYKGEKFRKHWYEICKSHQNKVGFDVVFSEDTDTHNPTTYRVDVKPQIDVEFKPKLFGEDIGWMMPAITSIITDFAKNNGNVSKIRLFIDGVELTNKVRDAFTNVINKIKGVIKSVKLSGTGVEFKV